MKTIHIILRSSRRGSDNTNREIFGPAFRSREEALAAILEEVEFMYRNGDDPGREGRETPQIVPDEENSNHNRGALKFKDPNAEGLSRIDIWDPTTCPEGSEDLAELSDWWERFDIEEVSLAEPVQEKPDVYTVCEDREYINDDILRLGQYMWDEKEGTPKDTIVLENPIPIHLTVDGRGYLDFNTFNVKSVSPGRDDIPMVHGHWDGEDKEECLALINHYTENGRYYEDRFWHIENLVSTILPSNENEE